MNKAVKKLLAVAVTLLATGENAELQTAHDALVALGEKATHTNKEYKALKVLVDKAQTDAGANVGGNDDGAGADGAGDGEKLKPKATKKLSMAGIRMIGNTWYHKSDNYKKGFATAQLCAEHFNK